MDWKEHPAASKPDPRLNEVVLEVWSADRTQLIKSMLVNHNEQYGRALTALEARKALLAGYVFVSRLR